MNAFHIIEVKNSLRVLEDLLGAGPDHPSCRS
jgi:hypothetical protein